MDTLIKYENTDGLEITAIQAHELEDYVKVFYINRHRKRWDYYYDNELEKIGYYLAPSEDIAETLMRLTEIYPVVEIHKDYQTNDPYTQYNWEAYVSLKKIAQGKDITDARGRILASSETDLDTGAIITLNKYYYIDDEILKNYDNDDDLPGFGEFEFEYYSNKRKLESISLIAKLYSYEDYWISDNDNALLEPYWRRFIIWEDNSYYHQAEPLLPNNGSISIKKTEK
jgi:hypothetical protein